MLDLKRTVGTLIIASSLLTATAAQAKTYYVATTGSNSDPGTESQPWRTVAHAAATMVAGDTTYVRGGLYGEATVALRRSGTASAPIKLLNYPGESPIIHCIDFNQTHRIYIANSGGEHLAIGWITIEGFEIRQCYNGIKWHNLHDSVIRRNWIHDSRLGSGIVGGGSLRVLLDRNVLSTNAITDPTPPGGHGIYINGSRVTITNNLIYDNRGYGIQLNGSSSAAYDPAKYAGVDFAHSHNWIIANNTFAYSRELSGLVIWGSLCNNTRVENNIFYENAVQGSAPNGINFVSTAGTGITIRNNLSFASGSGGKTFLGTEATEEVHYTQSGNIVNTVNPAFVNAPSTRPASPNFALTERSPARDAGIPLAETRTAFDGTSRPQESAYDIGAYEYKGGGDVTPPAAPVALQVF